MAERFEEDGLVVLAVNAWDEPASTVRRFVKHKELKQTMVMNGGEVFARTYGLKAVPTVYWIDRGGRITAVEGGFHGPESLARRRRRWLRPSSRLRSHVAGSGFSTPALRWQYSTNLWVRLCVAALIWDMPH